MLSQRKRFKIARTHRLIEKHENYESLLKSISSSIIASLPNSNVYLNTQTIVGKQKFKKELLNVYYTSMDTEFSICRIDYNKRPSKLLVRLIISDVIRFMVEKRYISFAKTKKSLVSM